MALSLRGQFVGAAAAGKAGGLELRSRMTWHGAARGQGGGISLEGGFR
jgi:hypothetical protein